MFRRALAIAVAVMLLVPVVAQARDGGLRMLDGRVPSAQVQTAGSGAITFAGRMVVNGTIPDRGTVQIIDRAGDASAHLGGEVLKFNRRGRISVRRASGILFVTGSNVQVAVQGGGLSFAAAGNGRARFLGSGTYRLNSGEEKAWGPGWIRIEPDQTSRRGRR
ncbi:MAG TPA: hypothetical protein PKD59_16565 [Miltoncostaeaceae bacterium]|nr:hypothetical protein [Miltoncostaeaceae bacterium]